LSERRISARADGTAAVVDEASGDKTRRFDMEPLIVVGVDGSDESRSALCWAVDEARLRGARLRVVHAWYAYPALVEGVPVVAADWEALGDSADTFLQSFIEETVGKPEGVQIEAAAVHRTDGTAAEALVQAAREAQLLVVGSRGHGGFAGLLLGSVSQQCVHHAPCPVVVVRGVPAGRTDEAEAVASAAFEGPSEVRSK
jgi:nucleotide-binding universal stress UspA family protein